MLVVLIILAASGVWLSGIALQRTWHVKKLTPEYWWALVAFFFGGVGALSSFGIIDLTANEGTAIRMGPLIIFGLILAFSTLLSRRAFVPFSGLALIFYFGILFAGDGLLMPLASFLAFLPVLFVPAGGYDRSGLLAGAASGISLFLLLLCGLCVSNSQTMLRNCGNAPKCSYWGVRLGEQAEGNALGMYLAAAAAVTLLAATTWRQFTMQMSASLVLVDLTSSRSGLVSWVVVIGLALAYFASQRLHSRLPVAGATIGVCGLAAALPFLNWSPSDLTYRPVLWWHAMHLISDRPLLGYGASYWARDETTFRSGKGFPLEANYATHNIVLELLVSGGVVGLLAFATALILAAAAPRSFSDSLYVIALIGVVAGLSLTEVSSAPGRNYLVPGMVIYLFMVANSKRMESPSAPVSGLNDAYGDGHGSELPKRLGPSVP